MTSEELRALSEDIKKHGPRQPIAIIENLALQREIADLKTKRQPVSEASRCSICHEKKPAVLRPVFICDSCVDIHEVREATPPVDDGLDIPANLRRDKQTETTP
jgi:ribosomal protein S14